MSFTVDDLLIYMVPRLCRSMSIRTVSSGEFFSTYLKTLD